MQCLNIAQPLGQGLWEGVPLREVLKLVGRLNNIRRVYYWGFHNNDPKQLFQSSLSYTQVMETPPWDLGPFVAYRLNGQPISLLRGGPVRMIVPWAHGFKSIKWLQRIMLTNDYRANDTYANGNNDLESYLKTAAYLDDDPGPIKAGPADRRDGHGDGRLVGAEARRILAAARRRHARPARRRRSRLADGALAAVPIEPPPTDWGGSLPDGVMPNDVWGFDPRTGRPKEWPMRFSWALLVGDAARPEARRLRVPRPHRGPERLRPAGAAAVSEVGAQRGAGEADYGDGMSVLLSLNDLPSHQR